MIKGNQRCNGFFNSGNNSIVNYITPLKTKSIIEAHNVLSESENNASSFESDSINVLDESCIEITVKDEILDDYENKTNLHSIIGLSNKVEVHKLKPRVRRSNLRGTYHETLQRIDPSSEHHNHYQQHWFSGGLERLKLEDRSRQERLEITRYELRRQLKQVLRNNVGKFFKIPRLEVEQNCKECLPKLSSGCDRLVAPRLCDISNCSKSALPCTRYCTRHIMHNKDQVLFSYCTAKFADNTQCSIPVFDISHELPLCPEHARKRDNYKMYQETKPKKLRKKVKASAMIRPQKRSKKRKRSIKSDASSTKIMDHSEMQEGNEDSEGLADDMVEQVLAMDDEPDAMELVSVDQALVTQASTLLEESDITNVLSTIQADDFDFFTVNRNGEYEPTREETEELERALAAVDNDVKSLEKLTQSQGLLDSLLDEHTLVESLVQIPDMFHNGYAPCGDSMTVGQTSRLLPVEPQTQS